MPSRRRHISASAGASASSNDNLSTPAAARSAKSWMAGKTSASWSVIGPESSGPPRSGQANRHFSIDKQRLATGGQYAEVRNRAKQSLGKHGSGIQNVLTIVEHQQGTVSPQRRDDFLGRSGLGLIVDQQRCSDCAGDEVARR